MSPTSSPEDGNRSIFRTVAFFNVFYNTARWTKSRNPAILNSFFAQHPKFWIANRYILFLKQHFWHHETPNTLLIILWVKQFHSVAFVDSLTDYGSRHATQSIDMHGEVFIPPLTLVHCLCVSVHLNPPWADLYSTILCLTKHVHSDNTLHMCCAHRTWNSGKWSGGRAMLRLFQSPI